MGSYDLEAVNEPLEEAASQLSFESLRDHNRKNALILIMTPEKQDKL